MNGYIIHWRNTKTGATGHGDPKSKEVAEEWSQYANAKTDGLFYYWIEPAPELEDEPNPSD